MGIRIGDGINVSGITLLWLLAAGGMLFPLFSQEAGGQRAEAGTLSFRECLEDLETNPPFLAAADSYEKSRLEIDLYRHPGDGEISVQPGVKTQYTENGVPGQTDLTLKTELSFVLGRSLIQEDRYRAAEREYRTEKLNLETVRREEILALYRLYSDLWLLQLEHPLLIEEEDLARNRYQGQLRLYESGAATLADVEDREEDLQEAEAALSQNLLRQRIAWFALEQARGLSGGELKNEIPLLENVRFSTEISEMPVAMTESVMSASPSRSALNDNIAALSDTAERLEKPDWNLLLKPFLSYGDHDWTMTYSWENRNLSMDYLIPLAVLNGTQTAQSAQNNWVTGMNLTLVVGTGKSDRLDGQVQQAELARQKEILKDQTDRLSLELRTLYQQLIQAEQALDQARDSSIRQGRLKNAVDTRYEAGGALRTDQITAELSERRSLWKVEEARIDLQQAYMALMALAGDFTFLEN